MRYGEVWMLATGSKVLVVSSDSYHVMPAVPLVVPVVRGDDFIAASYPYVVGTVEADPVVGSILVPEIGLASPEGARCVGMATGATMVAVGDGLRALFNL